MGSARPACATSASLQLAAGCYTHLFDRLREEQGEELLPQHADESP